MRPLTSKWLVLIGTALLIGLTLTPFVWHTLGDQGVANVGAGAMGRGGQFEKALLW